MKKEHGNYSKSYFHSGGPVSLLGWTIPEHFARVVKQFPDREAVVSVPQKKRLTYAAFSESVDPLARGLAACGFGKGDRIGIWSTNNLEWLLLQMATARLGAILVTINPAYRMKELAYALRRSEVQGLFVIPAFRTSDYVSMLLTLIPELKDSKGSEIKNQAFPLLRRVVLYDPAAPRETPRFYPGFSTWADVLDRAQSVSREELDRLTASLDMDDPINIQYTSGTTGYPKAVVLTHHNILNNAYFTGLAMHLTEKDRLCVTVPFYHCFGLVLANLVCLSHGACVVIACEHFDALEALQAIEAEKCTAIHGVPTMFIAELEHPELKNIDISTLRTGIMAGAPCPPALVRRVVEEMHCPEVLIGYGETEASPLTHLTSRDDTLDRRMLTVGKNLPHQEVKIIDVATGATLPIGQTGEICFRGYHVMKGYYEDSKATRGAIDENGWLRSGDLGTMDADGYVRITGRLKEMIIRGGENIYPREIEEFIYNHPKVAGVAVFGVPDEYYGEEVMAWIRLHAGETATGQEIRDFCRGNLAHFKIPRYIWFVEDFPMTVTGKLQKFRMREIAMEKMQNM
ncbi:MAG: AMP-binding protein [Thermodesulfobacteriota bacterium]